MLSFLYVFVGFFSVISFCGQTSSISKNGSNLSQDMPAYPLDNYYDDAASRASFESSTLSFPVTVDEAKENQKTQLKPSLKLHSVDSSVDSLFDLIKKNDVKKFKEYFFKNPQPDLKDDCGKTLLFVATYHKNLEIMKFLLDGVQQTYKADPDCFSDFEEDHFMTEHDNSKNRVRENPLFFAVKNERYSAVELLLKYKANPNLMDDDQKTPLWYAVELRNFRIVRALCAVSTKIHDSDMVSSPFLLVIQEYLELYQWIDKNNIADMRSYHDHLLHAVLLRFPMNFYKKNYFWNVGLDQESSENIWHYVNMQQSLSLNDKCYLQQDLQNAVLAIKDILVAPYYQWHIEWQRGPDLRVESFDNIQKYKLLKSLLMIKLLLDAGADVNTPVYHVDEEEDWVESRPWTFVIQYQNRALEALFLYERDYPKNKYDLEWLHLTHKKNCILPGKMSKRIINLLRKKELEYLKSLQIRTPRHST